jgi:mono/diheme cytochrome c family protein
MATQFQNAFSDNALKNLIILLVLAQPMSQAERDTSVMLAGALFALPLFTAVGCGPSTSDIAAVTALTGDATHGKTVYEANCQGCHGADGASGTAKHDIAGHAASDLEGAVRGVLAGKESMPSFQGLLSNQDIADVMAYLKSL